MKSVIALLLLAMPLGTFAQKSDPNLGIIPAPVSVNKAKGEFRFTPETIVMVDSPDSKAMKFFAEYLRKAELATSITDMARVDKKHMNLKNTVTLSLNFKGELPPEGYELRISEENIELRAHGAGMFYGMQTLMQLIHKTSPGYAAIPCATIKDYPRFSYRGMHLDVSRHFFDVNFVKKYIDVMAMYKLNYFHWHLTDDQGWRIEIKKYPKLTEIGSKRAQTKVGRAAGPTSIPDLYDNTPHGGFYTQEQIREVVAYASSKFINVVPEIEMPSHSLAALAAYPELSCDATKTYKVGETWGSYDDVFCPTNETFTVLYDILREVMDMFPGKYMHIGGDECNKVAWKKSEFCRQLIIDNQLKNEEGLQSYFIGKIEKYINSQGVQMIGWDEILEGGLAPNATVMSWRGEKGGIAAAQLGHDVIMTPGSGGMYFDHAQSKSPQEPLSIGGNAPLEKTYNYDPIPSVLSGDQKKRVIGVQANLWTEYVATTSKAEYMLLPRMLALSETGWSQPENKDYKKFSEQRIPSHLAMLERYGYNYRVPVAIGASDTTIKGDKFKIELAPSVEGAKIYYTIDGSDPTDNDLVYTTPLEFTVPDKSTVAVKSVVITPSGKKSIITTMKLQNGSGS
jgi:hexosaminidase